MGNWRKVVRRIIVAAYGAMFIGKCSYDNYLMRNRPDHLTGNFIVEQADHSKSYFITWNEYLISLGPWIGIIILGVVYGLVEYCFKLED